MATSSAQAQKSSRWGSFLSSVESRLDTILAEEDPKGQQKPNSKTSEQAGKKDAVASSPARPASPVRPGSGNRAQDRLNEKLARAMATKYLAKKSEATPVSSGVPSRVASPVNDGESPRGRGELRRELSAGDTTDVGDGRRLEQWSVAADTGPEKQNTSNHADSQEVSTEQTPPTAYTVQADVDAQFSITDLDQPLPVCDSLETRHLVPSEVVQAPQPRGIKTPGTPQLPAGYKEVIAQYETDREVAELRRQEETQDLLEKIDALQTKLQYLTKEAAADARTASAESSQGSVEQKLADKDEKIALLIEEGQKLSQAELKHMTTIKKLRAKSAEDEKAAADARRVAEKHENSAREAQDKAKKAVVAEKQALDKLKNLSRLEKDLDSTRADRDKRDSLIRDLQMQLSKLTSASKEAEEKARADALDSARKRTTELEDELSCVKSEKELAEKEHQNVLREMREKAEREKERARIAEVERQGELNILESRLEAYRARAEEASAGQGGDVQAKLLRQIETLQNQYAIARENWQGIEGSLLSRVTAFEKERDDFAKREAVMRRKAREINTKCRRLEEEFEKANTRGNDLDAERSSLASQLRHLRDQLNKSETEVNSARNDLKAERESWESRQAQRIEEARFRMGDEFLRSAPANILAQMRTESPVLQTRTRKSSNAAERSSPNSRRVSSYGGLGLSHTSNSPHERPLSRHSSAFHMNDGPESKPPTSHSMMRTDSMSTVPNISLNNGVPETPSIDHEDSHPGAEDDFFTGVHIPTTPPERTINDLVSVSTAGAGPSVQLVERMSAAVRRLESEKAAHKDELVRLAQQRDEAREQVVELMRDNEGKKAVDERLRVLEQESGQLRKRYETTLEMLGEKSEKVEEQKADIVDLKSLLREMVEEQVK